MNKKYYIFIILIIIILVALTMVFIFKENENISNNNEVKENISSNSVERNISENDITESNVEDTKKYKILGTYKAKRPEGTEAFVYVFSDDSVIFASDAWDEGNYVIEGNKIKINYTVTHSPVDNSPMDFVREPEELTIEDENTLVKDNGTKYYKTSDDTTWGDN